MTRRVCLVIGLQLALAVHATASGPPVESAFIEPIRSIDGRLVAQIADGVRLSPTFAALVERVRQHRALVLIRWVPELKGHLTGALLDPIARTPDGTRLLRVLVAQRPRVMTIATIAHELQHVLEVLDVNADTIAAAYAAIPAISLVRRPRSDLTVIETAAAVEAGQTVYRELMRRRVAR